MWRTPGQCAAQALEPVLADVTTGEQRHGHDADGRGVRHQLHLPGECRQEQCHGRDRCCDKKDTLIPWRASELTIYSVAILRRRMSRNQRIGLIVAAVLVAVLAFVIASPGDDDEGDQAAQTTTTPQAETATDVETETTPTETEPETPAPPKAVVTGIEIRAGEVVGGPAEIRVTHGDRVLLTVTSDAADDIHLHGYDIERKVAPGQPASSASWRNSRASSRSRATWPRTPAATRCSRPSSSNRSEHPCS